MGGTGGDMQAKPLGAGTTVSSAAGWFSTEGVTSITDSKTLASDSFSIQMNPNRFESSVCDATPGCTKAWEQFLYSNKSNSVYLEFWLFGSMSSCPSGWTKHTGSGAAGCFKNYGATSGIPDLTTSLSDVEMIGEVVGGTDSLTLETSTDSWLATTPDTLGLAGNWESTQFNVFGTGGCSEALFNSGSLVEVFLTIGTNLSGNPAPVCHGGSPTCESNNLDHLPSQAHGASSTDPPFYGGPGCCPFSGPLGGGIAFWEGNPSAVGNAPDCRLFDGLVGNVF